MNLLKYILSSYILKRGNGNQEIYDLTWNNQSADNDYKRILFKNQYLCQLTMFNKTAGLNHLSHFTGFDLAERFSLRHVFCEGDKTCFKLGSSLLIRDTM